MQFPNILKKNSIIKFEYKRINLLITKAYYNIKDFLEEDKLKKESFNINLA